MDLFLDHLSDLNIELIKLQVPFVDVHVQETLLSNPKIAILETKFFEEDVTHGCLEHLKTILWKPDERDENHIGLISKVHKWIIPKLNKERCIHQFLKTETEIKILIVMSIKSKGALIALLGCMKHNRSIETLIIEKVERKTGDKDGVKYMQALRNLIQKNETLKHLRIAIPQPNHCKINDLMADLKQNTAIESFEPWEGMKESEKLMVINRHKTVIRRRRDRRRQANRRM